MTNSPDGGWYPAPQWESGLPTGIPFGGGSGYPPRRDRTPLIVAVVVCVVVVVAAVIIAVTLRSPQLTPSAVSATPTTAASDAATTTTTTTASSTAQYQVVPLTALPTPEQVHQVNPKLNTFGSAFNVAGRDGGATPAQCALANDPGTTVVWGDAKSVSVQQYRDGHGEYFDSSGAVGLAVFANSDAAQASLRKVIDAVHSCPTVSAQNATADNSTMTWSIVDVQAGAAQITWGASLQSGGSRYCSKAYRVAGNLASAAGICSDAHNNAAPALVGITITNATSK